MIPDKRWFPASLQERAAWYENFSANIAVLGVGLGLTPAEVTQINTDSVMIGFLASTTVTLDAYADAIRTFRKISTEGDIGDPNPIFPADLTFSPTPGSPTGMFERLDGYVKRIRVAPTFTDEAGALLGIIPTSSSGPTLDLPPVISASVDPGNVIEVKFKKGGFDGLYIETNVDGAGFEFKEKALRSPAVFSVPASPTGVPRGVQIRARFLDGNSPVGDWSDIVVVQTIP